MNILGIDIGGSGIKAAPVDLATGALTTERLRIPTPEPSTPGAVAAAVADLVRKFAWQGPVGCTFPARVKRGIVQTAANVDKSWINTDGQALFRDATGLPVTLINDAAAAGLAEMEFGAGRGHDGVVLLLTFGTGIGCAFFYKRVLIPNTELGHMEIRGKEAEKRAAASVRENKNLTWEEWAARVDEYLDRLEFLFAPDLFIIGGGVSKRHDKFLPLLKTQTPVVPAQLFNDAGIVGAALAAQNDLAALPLQLPPSTAST